MSLSAQRDEQLFAQAVELPVEQRGSFLDGACGGNVPLRARIEALLALHDSPESVMASAILSEAALSSEEKAGDVIGRYKLLQKVGEGGCGVVWMAEQEEPVRRRIALKVIKLGMDTKAVVARFEAERQALAMMDHPNIAKVHDAGSTATGRPYFVMELVRGIPITKYCDENHLTPKERLELFIKVCQAIQHAHQKGVIHRDIKPSNILVTVNDGAPTPKVIDFGIAKATQGKLTDATVFTAFEQFIGTPVYMSPEQAEMSSLDIDTRSDIYSLGVLLYELLTGRPPFDPKAFARAGVDEIRQHIREDEPPTPSRRLQTLDDEERTTIARLRNTAVSELSLVLRGDLDWIIMRCLEKDRTRRYDTANGLAMDIQRHLRNEPVTARPPSSAYLLQKLIRRHRFGFAAAAAIFGVVSVGAVVSTWQAVRARRAEREQSVLREVAQRAQAGEAAQRRTAEAQALVARQRAYAADMQLVQQALKVDNLVRAQELLYRHKPNPGERDLRGWEWRYLWQLCQRDAADSLCEGRAVIRALSVSHDGKWLATVERGARRLALWNLATRKETRVDSIPADGRVAFAPAGPLLAASAFGRSDDSQQTGHRILLWNTQTRKIVGELPTGGPCSGLLFSADAQTLVAATQSPENKITVWRVEDGTILRSIDAPQSDDGQHGTSFAASPDLRLGAHAAPGQQLRVVDLRSGLEQWSREAANEGSVAGSLAFSPDGKVLASGALFADASIRLWDAATGNPLRLLEGHQRSVYALLFWPDGKKLASAGADRTIRIWDVASGLLLQTLRGHKLEVWRLALLPDNTTLVSGGKDGSVYLWDTETRREEPTTQFATPIENWRFAEDSQSILTVNSDGRIARWYGRGFREMTIELELGPLGRKGSFEDQIMSPEFSPDLRFIAIRRTAGPREVEVWDITTRSLRYRCPRAAETFPVAVFRDRNTLRVFDDRNAEGIRCREWDLESGKEAQSWGIPVRGAGLLGVAFSSDGQRCLAKPEFGRAVVYDLRTGSDATVEGMPAYRLPQYSPDGSLVAASSMESHVVRLRETSTYRVVATLSSMMSVPHSVAFSADGGRLAVGAGDKEAVSLWDTAAREHLLSLEGRGTVFLRTEFSPDGNTLASRNALLPDWDGILHLWRAPSWEEIEAAEKANPSVPRTP